MVRSIGIFALGVLTASIFFLTRQIARTPSAERNSSAGTARTAEVSSSSGVSAAAGISDVPALLSAKGRVLPPPPSAHELPLYVVLPDMGPRSPINGILDEAEPPCRALVENGLDLIQSGHHQEARKELEKAASGCASKRAGKLAKWASCFAWYGQEPIGASLSAYGRHDEKAYYLAHAKDCWRLSVDFLSLEEGFDDLVVTTLLNSSAVELMFWRDQTNIVYKERDGEVLVGMLKQILNRNPNHAQAEAARLVIREVEDWLSKPRGLQ